MPRRSLEDRFFAAVRLDGPLAALRPDLGSCWPWGGAVDGSGYGVMWALGRPRHAHVVGWAIACNPEPASPPVFPPAGVRFEHFACEWNPCANPGHVRPKGAVENVLGARNLAAWHEGKRMCIRGHRFDRPNVLLVPGGWACRRCRKEVEQLASRERRRGCR